MTWLYDAHVHLSDSAYSDEMNVIQNSMNHLKLKACCVSMDFTSSKNTLQLAHLNPLLLPFVGIHPEKADDDVSQIIDLVEKNHDIISGIGEIGLDPTYTLSETQNKQQLDVFKNQLSLAEKFQKPVSIHSRKSLDQVLDILPSYSLSGVLLHWFDGRKQQLRKIMDNDYFVSYGPVMVYAKDKQVLLAKTSLERILFETDGPVRFSNCFNGKIAQIDYIPSVVFCASKILGLDYDHLCKLIEMNMNSYLGV